jgi:hypothetical protein
MKVAIVLTGHMRCWKQVYPNFKQRLIDRYNPDIFIETWEDEAYWDPHSQHGIVKDAPKVNFDELRNTYRPIAMRFDSYEKYQNSFEERAKQYSNFYHVPKNIISMLFKLGRGVLMLEDYMFLTGGTYDLVIRMRPDLVFNEPLPEFDPNKFYTLGYRNHMGQGTSDMIQVGNFFTISLFSKLLHHLPQIYRETGLLCPHVVSEHFIRRLGFPWEEFMINKTIMHTPLGEYKPKEMYQK